MDPSIRLIVGLGNAKSVYDGTRHNIGRALVDRLAAKSGARFRDIGPADVARVDRVGAVELSSPVLLSKLNAFMNVSGGPLKRLATIEAIQPDQVLVVMDDFMIPFGAIRLRAKGSAGGHNGLQSVVDAFGTDQVPRLRLGVGPVPGGLDPADFVLESFGTAEEEKMPVFLGAAETAVATLLERGYQAAMNAANKQHL